MNFDTLDQWLSHIEKLHSQTIDLGLERMNEMIKRLGIHFDSPVFTVGGTNGKGSTCAFLESALLESGYSVGVHTSPHLIRFNERVRLNGTDASDEDLMLMFSKVEQARGEMTLSYFEYTLLGILLLFMEKKPDALVLEIGLGGRLDAVNTIEPTVSIITSVGIDHTAYLGETRDKIGWEKAHIYRPGKSAVCADDDPPASLVNYAREIGAKLLVRGKDFAAIHVPGRDTWDFVGSKGKLKDLPLPTMPGEHQLSNASGAIEALQCVSDRLEVGRDSICAALLATKVTGRFSKVSTKPDIYLDVGHNPHAAKELAKTLQQIPGPKAAVFGMLSDKDRKQVCEIMKNTFDVWYLCDLEGPRGGKAEDLKAFLVESGVLAERIRTFDNVKTALETAVNERGGTDKITVFGSFLTVASAIEDLKVPVGRD